MKILVTGGAGFIGSALIRHLINDLGHEVLCIDKLSYAGDLQSLQSVENSPLFSFIKEDICNEKNIYKLLEEYKPQTIVNLAAETHVDRSIDNPKEFIKSNILGTFSLLQASLDYWNHSSYEHKKVFRFHHVSTDEVFGDLEPDEKSFSETDSYDPSSPYSASKASSDHLVRSWHRTYGLPVILSNCSNNYGPFQFPEKLIPLVILNAIKEKPLPIYGKGDQIRDWLFVEDHVKAIVDIFLKGAVGESYNVGGNCEMTNLEVVKKICCVLDEAIKTRSKKLGKYEDLITFVKDRPGHDKRYSIDSSKILEELNWTPKEDFDSGIKKTVLWYLKNEHKVDCDYERLGLVENL